MMRCMILCVLTMFFASPLWAANYDIDYNQSSIVFSGMHAGEKFSGTFKGWKGSLQFDKDDVALSKFRVDIDTSTAHTGNKMYDGTLKGKDWFYVKEHPSATFITTEIKKMTPVLYRVKGKLSIRNLVQDANFEFEIPEKMLDSGKVETASTLMLKRLDFDIGKESDSKAEWVENDITLTLTIVANISE